MSGRVIAVASDEAHRFSKTIVPKITLVAGVGIVGDAHAGVTVQHRSRVAADPSQPNLRQVHMIHAELFDELADKGFAIEPGDMGENIVTRGINLLALPKGTTLAIGNDVHLSVTGLRNPCLQIERFRTGLLEAVIEKRSDGQLIRKAGIMAVVSVGGIVRAGDIVRAELPLLPHLALEVV